MDVFNWASGRQNSGYLIKKLYQGKRSDAYLIKYEKGSGITWHKDPVEGMRHYRFNLTIWPFYRGGRVEIKGKPLFKLGPAMLLRPDLWSHRVLVITSGVRYVLSIGWAMAEHHARPPN